MSRGKMVNGYWIHRIKATFGDATAHWRVTTPSGVDIGLYPTYVAAAKAARGHRPPEPNSNTGATKS